MQEEGMMMPGQNAMKRQGAIAQPPAARCHPPALPGARASLSGPWPNTSPPSISLFTGGSAIRAVS